MNIQTLIGRCYKLTTSESTIYEKYLADGNRVTRVSFQTWPLDFNSFGAELIDADYIDDAWLVAHDNADISLCEFLLGLSDFLRPFVGLLGDLSQKI